MNKEKESILFGQFLKKHSELNLTDEIIIRAFNYQRQECISSSDCRKLGMILLEDFKIFKDEEHLKEYLKKFYDLKVSLGLNTNSIEEHYRTKKE